MTGPTRFRHICRKSAPAVDLENENVAELAHRSRQPKRSGSQSKFNEGKKRRNSISKQMYFSDDSYETTASQDERIAQALEQEKEEEKSRQVLSESKRKERFEEIYREKTFDIFHLPGLTFLKFTHKKIKFYFEPHKVATHVRENLKFHCGLKYYEKYNVWNIRRDSFPVNYKTRIYSIFYGKEYFSVRGETALANAILRIYVQLKYWAQEEQEYRQEKFLRYQNGEDIILDSDDEALFLTKHQREEIHENRKRILKRMIPPPDAKSQLLPLKRTRKKRRPKQEVTSDSE